MPRRIPSSDLAPEHTQIMRPHCVTARSASAVAPWDLAVAASFHLCQPPLDRPPPQGFLARIMCRYDDDYDDDTTIVARLCRTARIRDRATVLTIITKNRRLRERKNDTTLGREESERQSASMARRCQTRRHLITESRRYPFELLS